jgi:Protein of unknown function (DUF4230)
MPLDTGRIDDIADRQPGGARLLSWAFGVLCGVVLTALMAVFAILLRPGTDVAHLLRAALGSSTFLNAGQPAVVRQIQQLQRLETVLYTLENVVEGEHDYTSVLPKLLTADRILLIGHGEVVAGVDLGRISSDDVIVQGRSVSLRLPQPEVFSVRIDNQKTRVYSRDTGILVPVDPNLETDVRREAEHQLREAALKDGILQAAERNARATLTSFLKGLGFERVEIR